MLKTAWTGLLDSFPVACYKLGVSRKRWWHEKKQLQIRLSCYEGMQLKQMMTENEFLVFSYQGHKVSIELLDDHIRIPEVEKVLPKKPKGSIRLCIEHFYQLLYLHQV